MNANGRDDTSLANALLNGFVILLAQTAACHIMKKNGIRDAKITKNTPAETGTLLLWGKSRQCATDENNTGRGRTDRGSQSNGHQLSARQSIGGKSSTGLTSLRTISNR